MGDTDEQIVKLVYDARESLRTFELVKQAMQGNQDAIQELIIAASEADKTGQANIFTINAQNAAQGKLSVTISGLTQNYGEVTAATVKTNEETLAYGRSVANLVAELNKTREAAQTNYLLEQQQAIKGAAEASHAFEINQAGLAAQLIKVKESAQTAYLKDQQQATLDAAIASEKYRISQLELGAETQKAKAAAQTTYIKEQQEALLAAAEAAHKEALAQSELAAEINRATAAAQTQAHADRGANQLATGLSTRFAPTASQGASVGEVNALNSAISRMYEAVRTGSTSAARAQEIFNNVWNRTTEVYSAAEQKIATASSDIISANERLGQSFRQAQTSGQSAAQGILISWQSLARFFITHFAYTAVYRLISAMREGIKSATDFEIKISEIRTISQGNQRTFEDWTNSVRDLSDALGEPIKSVEEGLYQTLSNQIAHGAEATRFLSDAMLFAKTTVASTDEGVNLLSSAINSYNLKASDAFDVSAQLFKVIDLGRVRAGELANSFGRVTAISSALGVSLAETGSAIAVLTNQGIKYDEAFTLVNGITTKLLKPTDEMKKLFKEWGVESGQAAIQAFGFAGVLKKIEEASNGSSAEIGALFSNIRAIRGVLGLSGPAFDKFNDYLVKIKNSAGEYAQAIDIARESSGFKLQVELQKLQNLFTVDFGGPALDFIIKWSSAMGGLVPIVKEVTSVVKVLVETWLLMKGFPLILGSINSVLLNTSAALFKATKQTVTFTAAQQASFNAFKANIASFGIALAVSTALFTREYFAKLRENIENASREGQAAFREYSERTERIQKESLTKQTNAFKDNLTKQFQLLGQHIAIIQKLLDAQVDVYAESYKIIANNVKDQLGLVLETGRTAINDLKNQIKEAEREVKNSAKNIRDIQAQFRKETTKINLIGATPVEDAKILVKEIGEALAEASKQSALIDIKNPNVEDAKAQAREAAKEAVSLEDNLAQRRAKIDQEIVKKKAEIAKAGNKDEYDNAVKTQQDLIDELSRKHKTGELNKAKADLADLRQGRTGEIDDASKAKLEAELKALQDEADALGTGNDALKERNRLLQIRTDLETKIGKLAEDQKKAAKAAAAAETLKFDDLKRAADEFIKFDVKKNPKTGKAFDSPAEANAAFDSLRDKLLKQLGPGQQDLFTLIAQQQNELKKQLDTTYNKEYLEALRTRLEAENKLIVDKRNELTVQLEKIQGGRSGTLTEINGIAATAEAFGKSAVAFLHASNPLSGSQGDIGAQIINVAQEITDLTKRLSKGNSPELVKQLDAARGKLKDLFGETAQSGAFPEGGIGALQIKDGHTAADELTRLDQLVNKLKGLDTGPVTAQIAAYDAQIQKVQTSIQTLGQIQQTTFQSLQTNLPKTVADIIADIDKIIKKVEELKALGQGAPTAPGQPGTGPVKPISLGPTGSPIGQAVAQAATNNTNTININLPITNLTGNKEIDVQALAGSLRNAIRRGDIPALA